MMNQKELSEDRFILESEIDEILLKKLKEMKLELNNNIVTSVKKEHPLSFNKHQISEKPLPPKPKLFELLNINDDFAILIDIFQNEYTAEAIIKALKESPAEIQIIAKLIINLYEKIDRVYGE